MDGWIDALCGSAYGDMYQLGGAAVAVGRALIASHLEFMHACPWNHILVCIHGTSVSFHDVSYLLQSVVTEIRQQLRTQKMRVVPLGVLTTKMFPTEKMI